MTQPSGSQDVVVVVDTGDKAVAWHTFPDSSDVLKSLGTTAAGLSTDEADTRLLQYGPNRLTPPQKPGFLKRLWAQLNNVLIFVLIGAAIVTGILMEWAEVGLILGVILINVGIGMFQEGRAEKAAEAIKAMLSSSASILRDGERHTIDADGLVPGDIILLKSGDKVPADVRLLDVTNLQVQEAMLTGESVPVSKNLTPVAEASALGDRKCMAYSATTVMAGKGTGVVVATGDAAEIGKINKMVSTVDGVKTDLMVQLEIIGRWISIAVAVIALTAFLLARFRHEQKWGEAFKTAVAIAVAIIPEGLPAVVTICLAIGTTKMAHQAAIIRQLPAVETLGSLTVICSDKTGTLTKNEMTVVALRTASTLYNVSGVGYAPEGTFAIGSTPLTAPQLASVSTVLEGSVLCNDSALSRLPDAKGRDVFVPQGAPTEVSLITAALKAGINIKALQVAKPRVASVPFESEHKFMATVHLEGDKRVMFVKGAPDRLLTLCSAQVAGDDQPQLAHLDLHFWQQAQADLSSQGLRVIALCRAELPASQDLSTLTPLTLLKRTPFLSMVAMLAILDPPREEAIQAAGVAHTAGITVKMITGDHALTALAIGRKLNITGDGSVLTGLEVDAMTDEQLADVVMGCNIFARASPENKLRIVRALQARQQVVAMTGDGVNDAPALKAANIGVAMGITGTDVSKEAAKMVLADDNFATIVAAVREGRRVWDNLRKILVFNLPVNFAQGLSILWAYILDLDHTPLTAIQVLYVNMITAVTMGLMLAAEPAEPSVMTRPPRRAHKRLMGKLVLWRCVFVTAVIVSFVLGMFMWGKQAGYSLAQRRAEAFNTLVFCEIGYSITTRFLKASTLHSRTLRGNLWCYFSIAVTAGLQVFLTYTPGVQGVFEMSGLDAVQWVRVMVCMVLTYLIVEGEKALVDPVLMPFVRPILGFIEAHTPGWLSLPHARRQANPPLPPPVANIVPATVKGTEPASAAGA